MELEQPFIRRHSPTGTGGATDEKSIRNRTIFLRNDPMPLLRPTDGGQPAGRLCAGVQILRGLRRKIHRGAPGRRVSGGVFGEMPQGRDSDRGEMGIETDSEIAPSDSEE